MANWWDDFIFYLPGFASVPIVIAGMLGVWYVWRVMKRRKNQHKGPPNLTPEIMARLAKMQKGLSDGSSKPAEGNSKPTTGTEDDRLHGSMK